MSEVARTTGAILGVYKNNSGYKLTETASKFLGDVAKVDALIKKSQ